MPLIEADGANPDPDLDPDTRDLVLERGFDFRAAFLALALAHGWRRLRGIVAGCGLRMLLSLVTFGVGNMIVLANWTDLFVVENRTFVDFDERLESEDESLDFLFLFLFLFLEVVGLRLEVVGLRFEVVGLRRLRLRVLLTGSQSLPAARSAMSVQLIGFPTFRV